VDDPERDHERQHDPDRLSRVEQKKGRQGEKPEGNRAKANTGRLPTLSESAPYTGVSTHMIAAATLTPRRAVVIGSLSWAVM
jgi:hypothetical protein